MKRQGGDSHLSESFQLAYQGARGDEQAGAPREERSAEQAVRLGALGRGGVGSHVAAVLALLERADEVALLGGGEGAARKGDRLGALEGYEADAALVESALGAPLAVCLQEPIEGGLHLSAAWQLVGAEATREALGAPLDVAANVGVNERDGAGGLKRGTVEDEVLAERDRLVEAGVRTLEQVAAVRLVPDVVQ